jgi:hypothetical protein
MQGNNSTCTPFLFLKEIRFEANNDNNNNNNNNNKENRRNLES